MADDSQPQPPTPPAYVKRLRRWRFALILAVVAAAVVAAAAGGWRFARTSSSPSNGPIILISIDALRADHLPLYGYRNVRTPAIDALAAEGVMFERAYAHSPQTLPSHASILSGQLPFETGVRDNVGFTIRPDAKLLPQMLKARGYASGAVVSTCLLRKETGLAQGFDFYDAEMPAPPADHPFARPDRAGEDSVAAAQRWIASLSSPRFFLFLNIDEPHAPYEPPERYSQLPPYDGEIAHADEIVGRFLKWLKGRGLYDRATVVLLSDHGEALGDHGEQQHGLFLYDETIHVPLVVKLPRDVNHGHRVALPVQHIDVVPTILDLLDVPRPAQLRGRSLRALLEGRRANLADEPLYAESFSARYRFGWSELQAITAGGYRYIRAPREELYDLNRDPAERTNLLRDRADTSQAMRAALDELVASRPGPLAPADSIPAPTAPSVEEREHLVSLGYVGTGPAIPATVASQQLPDPKDEIAAYERCRQGMGLAGQQRFAEAAAVYREVLAQAPELAGVWVQLAQVLDRAGRVADGVDAFRRAAQLLPGEPVALLGAANGLLRLGKSDEAKAQAALAVTQAPAAAHELLARIALARNDAAEARRQAELAQRADPALPMPLFVQGMLLYRTGKYEDAAPVFEQALKTAESRPTPIFELHYYYADTLGRLERYPEAEGHFKEEIRLFPRSIPARVSLAMLYRAERRTADLQLAIEDLARVVPTPEGYAAAARLWTIFGDKDRATSTRAEAKQRFGRDALVAREPALKR